MIKIDQVREIKTYARILQSDCFNPNPLLGLKFFHNWIRSILLVISCLFIGLPVAYLSQKGKLSFHRNSYLTLKTSGNLPWKESDLQATMPNVLITCLIVARKFRLYTLPVPNVMIIASPKNNYSMRKHQILNLKHRFVNALLFFSLQLMCLRIEKRIATLISLFHCLGSRSGL